MVRRNGPTPNRAPVIYNDVVSSSPAAVASSDPMRRTLISIALAGALGALLVLSGGWIAARLIIGSDNTQARARVEREVRTAFEVMARELRDIGAAVADPAAVRAAGDDNGTAAADLMTRVDRAIAGTDSDSALTAVSYTHLTLPTIYSV